MAVANGLYELRTMLNTGMALDVYCAAMTNGANVDIYAANGTNAQKFYVKSEADGYSLQIESSGKFVDVRGAGAANHVNVQQWEDNDTRAQRWTIAETGQTVTIGGVSCQVVTLRSSVSTSTAYMMDVTNAFTSNKTNVQLFQSNGTDAQKWALLPTELLDTSLSAPASLGWVAAVGNTDAQLARFEATKLYPTWKYPTSWPASRATFAIRYRSRTVGATSIGAWSAWNAWTVAPCTVRGGRAWLTAGLPAAATGKALEYEFQVRARTTNASNRPIHSNTTTATLRAAKLPTTTLASAAINYSTLDLGITTDYSAGTSKVRITSIQRDGMELLSEPYEAAGLEDGGAVAVPMGALSLDLPLAAGDSLTVQYQVGTDAYAGWRAAQTANLTAEYSAGHTLDMASTWMLSDGRLLAVVVPEVGTELVWTVIGRKLYPAYQTADGWRAIYPFGQDFKLYITGTDGTAWGDYMLDVSAADMPKGCHAWSWDGGQFLLEVVDGFMSTERQINAQADAASLNSREWETVHYSDTLQGTFDAVGTIGREITESDKAGLMALIRAHHVLYRAPAGEIADVGIDSVSYSSLLTRTEVKVSMTQESI